jgi:D-arabinose 1-dehydrogenase-like Zn-dependent alcohol dehydrogenase
MRAAVLETYHRPLVIRNLDTAAPGPGEVTLEVRACGLCLTDVHIAEGRVPTVTLPVVPGHEFAGVIAERGPGVTGWELGERVVVSVDVSCGRCDFCLRGETNRCVALKRLGFERNGGMAERVNVPAANLERLADAVPFEKAAIIPDAVVSIYRGLKHVGQVGIGMKVAILGVGGLGMQGVKIATMLGAEVTCTDLDDRKLERARGFGAVHTINPTRERFLEVANQLVGGFDVVLDNVGQGDSLLDAVAACRNGGTVVSMGYVDPRLQIPSYEVVIKEKRILGSRAITRSGFREVVQLVNAGRLDPDIGELVPISRVNEAMADLHAGRYLARTVLIPPFDR